MPATPRPKDVLDIAVQDILDHDSPYSYSTYTAVQRYLRQFNLFSRIEPYEVLVDAYLRGKKALRCGETIHNPHAWLKRTAYNIIREHYRKLSAQQLHEAESLDFLMSRMVNESWVAEEVLSAQLSALWEALEILRLNDPESARIIDLRIFQQLQWSEVREHLIQQGNEAPDVNTRRQRGARIKKQLRRIFHEANEPGVTI